MVTSLHVVQNKMEMGEAFIYLKKKKKEFFANKNKGLPINVIGILFSWVIYTTVTPR